MFRLMRWPLLLCGLLGFALAPAALATDPLYDTSDYQSIYAIPPDSLPNIDATNFLNNITFEVTFETINLNTTFFETWNTLNYTNNGTMICDMGFRFDTQTTNYFAPNIPAATFYNPGTVRCGSILDYGVVLSTESAYGLYPQAIVSATNVSIANGGSVDVGQGGLIQLTGQNVNLNQGILTLEGGGAGSVQLPRNVPAALLYYAGFGLDTNQDWNPAAYLTAFSALPSLVRMGTTTPAYWIWPFGNGIPIPTFIGSPLSTTPYQAENDLSTNDIIYRYVFVANSVQNVTANVYVDPSVSNVPGSGAATVEFVGTYTNPATGLLANNYLYVNDDYALGAKNPGYSTLTGIPNNFTFTLSSVQLAGGTPLSPNLSFQPFPNLAISNSYSFADVQCVPTTALTNSPSPTVTNYLAILPDRIQISASSNLDLSQSQISGQNYLSVSVPGQLNGSVGAAISSAYSDISVGVTNGNLMATNLLEPSVPAWSGTVEAWSTRFINLTTNSIITISNNLPVSTNSYVVTNDYRVVIVAAQSVPSTPSEVWGMALNATNSTTISDDYNILNSLYLNCVSLTLTTNGPYAPSMVGELNLQGSGVGWAAATPNLLYLTNYGDILLPASGSGSLGVFGSASVPYMALINNGLISDQGSKIWAANFESSGQFYNGTGQFTLQSQTTTLTNGYVIAGSDVSITTGSLLTSNLVLEADRSLTLTATNLLTDTGVTNGNIWTVGLSSVGNGISVPFLPSAGGSAYGSSLLGTTINLFAPTNRSVVNVWAGTNDGNSTAGFTNNLAVGQLILDTLGANSTFHFNGVGASNAIYVDRLELLGHSDYNSRGGTTNIPSLLFNNLVIYYADAVSDGQDVSLKLNGFNANHLVWVPAYVGNFSSTNLVFGGVTNTVNVGLAQNGQIDSNGDGIPNSSDPIPFFLASQINFSMAATNLPPKAAAISWNTISFATNCVYYSTNLLTWQILTNIAGYPANLLARQGLTNFISIFPPPSPGVPGWVTNVTVYDTNTSSPRFYRVSVYPWLTYPY